LSEGEEFIVDIYGSLFITRKTRDGGLACPVCGHSESSPLFFSELDLIRHIARHESKKGKEGE
jgi:hypothetical protein